VRIGRTIPPAAAPITLAALACGLWGILRGQRELERLESEIKAQFGTKHCFLVSSGKAAFMQILLALKALSPEKDEVLIPAFTCFSVPSAVVRAGLKVRLCDLRPGSLDMDHARLSAMLQPVASEQTASPSAQLRSDSLEVAIDDGARVPDSADRLLAIVPTHLFGYPADVTGVRALAGDRAITVIEDAAQAMGETVNAGKLGTLGDVGFFSLARGKAFSAVEGGVIITNNDEIAGGLRSLVHGLPGYGLLSMLKLVIQAFALWVLVHPMLFWIPRSIPFLRLGETLFETDFPVLRMSAFQAGLTRNWRRKLSGFRAGRVRRVNRWMSVLEKGHRCVRFIEAKSSGLIRFPVHVSDSVKRNRLLHDSEQQGLGVMPTYPAPINAIPELQGKLDAGEFPVAEDCAKSLVTLPTHDYVGVRDEEAIIRLLDRLD
jgi:perosamine synthetase